MCASKNDPKWRRTAVRYGSQMFEISASRCPSRCSDRSASSAPASGCASSCWAFQTSATASSTSVARQAADRAHERGHLGGPLERGRQERAAQRRLLGGVEAQERRDPRRGRLRRPFDERRPDVEHDELGPDHGCRLASQRLLLERQLAAEPERVRDERHGHVGGDLLLDCDGALGLVALDEHAAEAVLGDDQRALLVDRHDEVAVGVLAQGELAGRLGRRRRRASSSRRSSAPARSAGCAGRSRANG